MSLAIANPNLAKNLRKVGAQQWEEKAILVGNDGQRFYVVDVFDLATRTTKGTVYAMD